MEEARDGEEDREEMTQGEDGEVGGKGRDEGTPKGEEGGDRLANLQERAHHRHLLAVDRFG